MLFNSFPFAILFAIVCLIYFRLRHTGQNRLLLFASYVFYSAWDFRFLALILYVTAVSFVAALLIEKSKTPERRRLWLFLSVFLILGVLVLFKYFDFFTVSFSRFLNFLGMSRDPFFLNLILPIGISFYTFQALGYVFDVSAGKINATKDFWAYSLFISFFPQLVAGPIERTAHLLPQIANPRVVSRAQVSEGFFLCMWGLLEKVVVADNMAIFVDAVFKQGPSASGVLIGVAAYAFAIQIYADFDGYSNMARGLGKMLGFELSINFNFPYMARNPVQFWRRWHITLSNWLRDYLYIPLGGNRRGKKTFIRNIFITMLLGGLWHGASWTFVLWGFYHAVVILIYGAIDALFGKNKKGEEVPVGKISALVQTLVFFHVVCFGWLLFRSATIGQFCEMTRRLVFDFHPLEDWPVLFATVKDLFFICGPFLLIQFLQYRVRDFSTVLKLPFVFRVLIYGLIFYDLVIFGVNHAQSFIYFQF